MALERAIGVERGPAATAHVVALVGALPRELNARPAITSGVAAVEFSRHHDEAQAAEAGIIELDEAGLDQINSLLIPVVHLGDTPPAYDALTPGHATRVAARGLPGGQCRLKGLCCDPDYLADGVWLVQHGEHVVGYVGAGDGPAAAHVPPAGSAVAAGVRRILAISASPVGTTPSPGRPNPPRHDPGDGFIMRHIGTRIAKTLFGKVYDDLARMEDILRDSGLDWTILRPPQLTGKPLTGRLRTARGRNVRGGRSIPRADVAHYMLAVLDQPDTIGQVIGIAT